MNNVPFLCTKLFQKRGHYSRGDIIQERALFKEIRYLKTYFTQGGIKNWDSTPSSVWLTAWMLRIFSGVSFQDWEDYIYIDPLVSISKFCFITYLSIKQCFIYGNLLRGIGNSLVVGQSVVQVH